jgi:UDP-N-acetylmuramate: L-alanyl-gamma-D-glutamyl-meso-diaminopimelate ligase
MQKMGLELGKYPVRAETIPGKVRTVHLIAACGTAMGALACLLKENGLLVTGSDENVYPPMSTYLESRGISIQEGFSAANVCYGPDLVVVGNAVKRDNPEALKAFEMGLAYCSMPRAINHFLVGSRKAILVAGTHGKTTTAAITAWLLKSAGLDPAFVIGGFVNNFGGNFHLGGGEYVVLEADEYDTAFFDKRPKFLHYDPAIAVVTGVEFDHADIYQDLEDVMGAFDRFLAGMQSRALLVAYDQDPRIDALLNGKGMQVERYGSLSGSVWQLADVSAAPPRTRFQIRHNGRPFGEFEAPLAGIHNLHNALAAAAVCRHLHIPASTIAHGLRRFQGVKRRQEIRGVKSGITVIDDFAHHPTAVYETIRALKPFYPDGRLIAVFEPRTNTSMRRVFQGVYPGAFDAADAILIRKPPLLSKIPAGERFSSKQLVADLIDRGKDAHYFEETESIIEHLVRTAEPGDAILVMSNGGFDNIHERLLERL